MAHRSRMPHPVVLMPEMTGMVLRGAKLGASVVVQAHDSRGEPVDGRDRLSVRGGASRHEGNAAAIVPGPRAP